MAQIITVFHFSREPSHQATTYTGATGDVSGTSNLVFKAGFATTKIRFGYANYTGSGPAAESATTGTVNVQAAFQAVSETGVPVQLPIGGSTALTAVAPGQIVYTDWITVSIAAGTYCAIRTYATWAVGAVFPLVASQAFNGGSGYTGGGGDNYVQHAVTTPANANGSNQLLTTGSYTTWNSAYRSLMYGPFIVEGYASDGTVRPIMVGVGDSLTAGVGGGTGDG